MSIKDRQYVMSSEKFMKIKAMFISQFRFKENEPVNETHEVISALNLSRLSDITCEVCG